ncbi:MAG: hypothetical protein M4579_004666 [Chaenotheca gracillima]|nr:MAG: hypothetical protein M4579_004666 [Chaenotheca gracillima]
MAGPAALVVPALKKHTATVIMAHGLGDSGAGWAPIARDFQRKAKFEEVSFVFPNAPTIPITGNMGMSMPGWYDITSFSALAAKSQDEAGIMRSRSYIHSLIAAETAEKGIPSNRILLGGFSQGGALALLAGLTAPVQLGGVFAMSSYLLLQDKLQGLVPQEQPNKETKVWMGHGDSDPLVKHEWGVLTAEKLREIGFQVEFKTYPDLVHSADPDEIADLEQWIAERLPPLGDKAGSKA